MAEPISIGLPQRVRTLDDLLGAVAQMDGIESVVVVVHDAIGCTLLTVDGTSVERVNWMLDRAKHNLHRD